MIKDEIYHQCWDNIKTNVRTHIKADNNKLKTARQWALEGYVVNKPSPEHERGVYLWTNAYCQMKALYYFDKEVRIGSEDELKAFFEPERKKRRTSYKKRREHQNLKRPDEIRELCKKSIESLKPDNIKTASVIVIDVETTGLMVYTDELLQVSIISDKKEILYNSYLKPLYTKEWKDAEKINGITPDMVKQSPSVLTECTKINRILSQADVIIGYNHQSFDLAFLAKIGCSFKESAVIIDVAEIFSEIYGEWSDYFGGYKYQKLSTCAAYYNYRWEGNTHDSLADCLATLYCYEKIQEHYKEDN